ncbi:hypothetical protein QP162_22895 [Sphingomonas aurantiaca]|uniref:hypothetical protein n=1 Tax=Sphingomonas aurantiaca TaxID=185949 RepID=UPI002FE408CA
MTKKNIRSDPRHFRRSLGPTLQVRSSFFVISAAFVATDETVSSAIISAISSICGGVTIPAAIAIVSEERN